MAKEAEPKNGTQALGGFKGKIVLWYTKGSVEFDFGEEMPDAELMAIVKAVKSRKWITLPGGAKFRIVPPDDARLAGKVVDASVGET
jgi:hypothetical protein